jgi:hypothetical protein
MEAAITTYSKEAQRFYERGIAAARGGQRRIAAGLLTKAVQLDPRHEQAWLWLSGVLDEPNDIAFCLNAALKLNPDNVQAQKGLDWIRQRKANPTAAPAETPSASRLQQIAIPDAVEAEVAPVPAPAIPQNWWQDWRSSVRTQRILRSAVMAGLLVLLAITTLMVYLAPDPTAQAAPIDVRIPTALPDSAGVVQQTLLTAPEVNQALILRYLSDVGRVREQIRVAATNYRDVSDVTTVATEQIAAARTYRDVLRQAYTDLELIKTPTVLTAVHAEYKEGVQLEQAAFEDLLEYYTNYNVAIANRSALRLQESGGHYQRAMSGWATYQQQLSAPGSAPAFGER